MQARCDICGCTLFASTQEWSDLAMLEHYYQNHGLQRPPELKELEQTPQEVIAEIQSEIDAGMIEVYGHQIGDPEVSEALESAETQKGEEENVNTGTAEAASPAAASGND